MTNSPDPVQIQQVSKRFGTTVAVDQLSLTLQSGQLTALLGANGAGKTTTIQMMLGLLRPSAGTIEIFGETPGTPSVKQRLGAMLQSTDLPDALKVREHLELFAGYYQRGRKVSDLAELAGLTPLLERRYDQLSGGQKRRVQFALAMAGDPQLLFLDEPTTGLDITARRQLWQSIRELLANGTSVVLTTHYLEEAEALADRIMVMHEGKLIADGTPDQLKQRVGGKKIRFRTDGDTESLATIPGIVKVQQNGQYTELISRNAEDSLTALIKANHVLGDLTVTTLGIEDAFLSLTNTQRPSQQEQPA